jgi:hypothetical protein
MPVKHTKQLLAFSLLFFALWLYRQSISAWLTRVLDGVYWPVVLSLALLTACLTALLVLNMARWLWQDVVLFVRRTETEGSAETVVMVGRSFDDLTDWERALTMAAFLGNRGGWSLRSMLPYMTRPAWEKLIGAMLLAGVLVHEREGKRWAEGWTYPRFKAELKHGALTIPPPTGDVPAVSLAGSERAARAARAAQMAHEVSAEE